MALITNLSPNTTPAALLDADGRAILHLPSELGRLMLRADMALADAEMKFNIECPECSQRMGRPVYVMPRERADGRVEFICPHARRVSDITAQ